MPAKHHFLQYIWFLHHVSHHFVDRRLKLLWHIELCILCAIMRRQRGMPEDECEVSVPKRKKKHPSLSDNSDQREGVALRHSDTMHRQSRHTSQYQAVGIATEEERSTHTSPLCDAPVLEQYINESFESQGFSVYRSHLTLIVPANQQLSGSSMFTLCRAVHDNPLRLPKPVKRRGTGISKKSKQWSCSLTVRMFSSSEPRHGSRRR